MIAGRIIIKVDRLEELVTVVQDLREKLQSITQRVVNLERGLTGVREPTQPKRKGFAPTITQMESSLAESMAAREQLLIKRRTVGYEWSTDDQQALDTINREIDKKRKYIREYDHE